MAKRKPKEDPTEAPPVGPSVEVGAMDLVPKLGDAIKDMTLQLTVSKLQTEKYQALAQFWEVKYKELKDGSN